MVYKSILSIVIIVCMLLSFTACSNFPKPSGKPTILELEPGNSSQQGETETTTPSGNSTDITQPSTDPASGTEPSNTTGGVTLEISSGENGLVSGKLIYTIQKAYVVTNQKDIPTEGGFFDNPPSVSLMRNGQEQAFKYPEFIKDNGDFMDDCYLILVEISIKSENAVGNTDPVTGEFDDPYLFRSNRLTLVDMTDTNPDGFYNVTEARYFSNLGEHKEGSSVIRLEPGEEKTYTYGFFIGGYKSDGSKTDLSNLCLCNTYGNPDSILVKLGLGD